MCNGMILLSSNGKAKRLGREADHSPPSSAEVNECVKPYLHSTNKPSWHGTQLKKQRVNLPLLLSLPFSLT
jgi:hypothetical protein